MSLRNRGLAAGGLLLGAALALSACSGGSSSSGGSSAGAGGSFSFAIQKFQALTPSNCYDLYCSQVNKALFLGLFVFEPDASGALTPVATELTKSVSTPDDGKTWKIEINPGFTFTNGEKITAQTFVDTWNYAANGDNGQQLGFVFGPSQLNVVGFAEVESGKSKEMKGLKADSDTVISVELEKPMSQALFSNFVAGPQVLPMPKVAFEDPDKYEKQPIGNGPYKMTEPYSNQGLTVTKNPDFAGTPGNADSIDFKIYADDSALWADLQANELDVTTSLPQQALATAPQVLGDRFINEPGGLQYAYYGFRTDDPTFKDKDVRIGIAKSVNWDEINSKLYFDTRQRATSFAPSSIPGGGTDLCGDKCVFDAAKAKELIDGAGGVPGNKVSISKLASEEDDVVKAVCNQIQSNTGVECGIEVFKDFGEYLDALSSGKAPNGMLISSAWIADNPTIQNMVTALFASDGPYNDIGYNNPDFDRLLSEGTNSTNDQEQIAKWVEAEQVLLDDFYAWPVQFLNQVGAYSTNVSNVVVPADGLIDVAAITVNS